MRPPLQIVVAAQLQLTESQLPGSVRRFVHDQLFIPNSAYIIKERLGKPVYDVPKFFDLVTKQPPCLLLPRGFLGALTAFLDKEKLDYRIEYAHADPAPYAFTSNGTLYAPQEAAVSQAFAAGSGVIVAPPGSGKTFMGLALIARHQKPALILTHRKQLLDQWVERIQQYLGVPKKHIGRYSAAYKKPSDIISVGLLQSFARTGKLDDFADKFGVVIVDECHHIPAKTFRTVIAQLNTPHVYGLTATPRRKHNDEKLIYLYIGDIVATLQAAQEAPSLALTIRETSLRLPFDWKADRSELLAKVICYDTARNGQLASDIAGQIQRGRKTLVLSERKEHLAVLELYLRGKGTLITLSGDDSASKRTAKLARVAAGNYDVLLATGQLLGEGVHIDSIDTLVLAFPFSFEGKLIQYIGRLLHSGGGQVIDYHDMHVEVLDRQYKLRQRAYKKLL